MQLGFKELLALSRSASELGLVLSRPPGFRLSAVHRARGERLYELMMTGSARQGELLAIASGEQDGDMGFMPQGSKRALPRSTCTDCGADIADPGMRTRSDPSRCRECRRAKKRAYNATYRNGHR